MTQANNTLNTRPSLRRDLLLLIALSVLVNLIVALLTPGPTYADDAYYFNGGLRIANGDMQWPDLQEPYFLYYSAAPDAVPSPGFSYWQPFASLLASVGISVLRFLPPFRAAQMVYILLAALLPVMTYLFTLQLGERRHALLAGLLMVFSGMYVRYWSLPETFTPFAVSTAGALMLAGVGRKPGHWWAWLLAGVCAGVAHLTRADGLLVVAIVAFVALLPPRIFTGESIGAPLKERLLGAALSAAGYVLAMLPWYLRNLAVFGSIQPTSGTSMLWLIEYNDMFIHPTTLSAGRYFAAGWGTILAGKWKALYTNFLQLIGVQGVILLGPLALIGWIPRWRQRWLLPALLYGAALFAAMTFAFSFQGMRGGWVHSAASLVPFITAAAALGLDDAVHWAAARRHTWRADQAWRVFSAGSVVMALAVVAFSTYNRVIKNDRSLFEAYAEIGEVVDARVMVNNPPGYYAMTGKSAIPLTSGDETMLLYTVDVYDASYLILDENVSDQLEPLYEDGPSSPRIELIDTYGTEDNPVYLYRILPE